MSDILNKITDSLIMQIKNATPKNQASLKCLESMDTLSV